MAGGFLSKFFGGNAKAGPDPIGSAFAVFERWEKGLGQRALRYVRQGDDRPVLAGLGSVLQAQRQNKGQNTGQNAGQHNWQAERKEQDMFFNLVRSFGGQPDALARHVEVVSAAYAIKPYRSRYNTDLADETPDLVCNLLQFFAVRRHVSTEPIPPLTTFDDLLDAIAILGGTPADVITNIVPSRYAGYDFPVNGQPASEHVRSLSADHFVVSLARRKAADRAKVMKQLAAYPVAKDPAFLDFLMESAAAGSAQVRSAAHRLLEFQSPQDVVQRAIPMLDARAAAARTSAVQILGHIGSEPGLEAMRQRAEIEKSQDVLTAINHFTLVAAKGGSDDVPEGHYMAADDTLVEVPSFEPLVDATQVVFEPSDLAELRALDAQYYERSLVRHQEMLRLHAKRDANARKVEKPRKPEKTTAGDALFKAFNAPLEMTAKDFSKGAQTRHSRSAVYFAYHLRPWLRKAVSRLPDLRLVKLALLSARDVRSAMTSGYNPYGEELNKRILEGKIDIRQVLAVAETADVPVGHSYHMTTPVRPDQAGLLTFEMTVRYRWESTLDMPQTWPITANNLDVVLDALPPRTLESYVNLRALELLSHLPKLPKTAVDAVLYTALDARRRVSAPAQDLLLSVSGIDKRLLAALSDKRQAVRASAARFLADRAHTDAVAPLIKRLKTEKSETAKAEMISALSRLGGDTAPYLGRKALLKEATALAQKLRNAKLDWLDLDTAPALKWADGKPVDPVIPDAWLRLALKLKSPAGSPLFGMYFDQLEPASVTAFCHWVLTSWIAYDTWKPATDELRQKAQKEAEQAKASGRSWYSKQSVDELAGMFLRGWLSQYPNSGTDSKGILALTHRAPHSKASNAIAAYLKAHGKRVSQAKSLVEVLASMGTPEALQVLVATATRFKQRTVRELAETSVAQIAEDRGWSEDELADRSIPTGGIEEDGVLALEIGEDAKLYTARLGHDLSVKLFNPDGKEVKALPPGKDENTKEAKKLLSGAKKTVKTVIAQQATRLYDAMIGARTWPLADWDADLVGHPIMARLIERVIWRGLKEDGTVATLFRPTPEGDRLTADGDDADLSDVTHIDIAHTATVDEETRQAWLAHMDDFEVAPLFAQLSRPMRRLDQKEAKHTAIEDCKGWLTEAFKLRTATTKAGFERGPIEDGAGFYLYVKDFRNAGVRAELHFTGSYIPEENIPVAIVDLQFFKIGQKRIQSLQLGQVPAMVLSEAWNDLHEIAGVGAFDPEWEKKGFY